MHYLGLFSTRDQREMFWVFDFLSCLFSVCSWHHISFDFMNVLEGQASLISCGSGAQGALGIVLLELFSWWGVWGALPGTGRTEAALPAALQGMAGHQAAALAAGLCPSNGAVLLLCSLLRCPKHSEGISMVKITWARVSVFLSPEEAHQLLLQNQL